MTPVEIISSHIEWSEKLHDEQIEFQRELGRLMIRGIRENSGLPWPEDLIPEQKLPEEEDN